MLSKYIPIRKLLETPQFQECLDKNPNNTLTPSSDCFEYHMRSTLSFLVGAVLWSGCSSSLNLPFRRTSLQYKSQTLFWSIFKLRSTPSVKDVLQSFLCSPRHCARCLGVSSPPGICLSTCGVPLFNIRIRQARQSCSNSYTVVSGDTCAAIESKTGVSDSQLHALNPSINSGCTSMIISFGSVHVQFDDILH